MNPKLQSLYGLKFHPFRPDVPIEALHVTPAVDSFIRRVEISIADGGFVMITGDPGTGKECRAAAPQRATAATARRHGRHRRASTESHHGLLP
jgi:type II secretory pathway predicted ATPase ExeA